MQNQMNFNLQIQHNARSQRIFDPISLAGCWTRRIIFLCVIMLFVSGMECFSEKLVSAPVDSPLQGQSLAATTTIAIFHDQRMPQGFLPALIAGLRRQLVSGSPEIRMLLGSVNSPVVDPDFLVQILNGDDIVPNINVNNPITVYLHGDCNTIPRPEPRIGSGVTVSGALGWVELRQGRIEPFIHVDCSRIAEMVSNKAFGHDREQRNQLLAIAVSRVILHEWIHISTQTPHHASHGLAKAAFNVSDLVSDTAPQHIRERPLSQELVDRECPDFTTCAYQKSSSRVHGGR